MMGTYMDAVFAHLFQGGALDLLISLLGPFFSAMMTYCFMSRLLPNRLKPYSLFALALVYALWFNLRSPELFGTGYHLGMTIFINLWTPFILLCLFKGKFWQRVIVYWYFDITKAICEAIAFSPVLFYHTKRGFQGEWAEAVLLKDSSAALTLLYTLAFLSLFLLLGCLSLKIWRKLLLQKFQPFYLLFIALPMGQMYSLALVIRPNMGNPVFGLLLNTVTEVEVLYPIHSIFGILLCLAADLVLLGYAVSLEKRAALEEEVREVRHAVELEQTRYLELEQRREELAKIRHDFNNQLASIMQLIRSGEGPSAQALIESLKAEISKTE